MPPIGSPLGTDHEDTERLMSRAGFPDKEPDTTPWFHRTAVSVVAGGLAVIGLVVLVIAVTVVSDDSTRPAHTGVTPSAPAPPSASAEKTTPSTIAVEPPPASAVGPPPATTFEPPPALAVGPPPAAPVAPPQGVPDTPGTGSAAPPTIADLIPMATPDPGGPPHNWPRWLRRLFPGFPDGQ